MISSLEPSFSEEGHFMQSTNAVQSYLRNRMKCISQDQLTRRENIL